MFHHYHFLKFTSDFPNAVHVWLSSCRCNSVMVSFPSRPPSRKSSHVARTLHSAHCSSRAAWGGAGWGAARREQRQRGNGRPEPTGIPVRVPGRCRPPVLRTPRQGPVRLTKQTSCRHTYSEQEGLRAQTVCGCMVRTRRCQPAAPGGLHPTDHVQSRPPACL